MFEVKKSILPGFDIQVEQSDNVNPARKKSLQVEIFNDSYALFFLEDQYKLMSLWLRWVAVRCVIGHGFYSRRVLKLPATLGPLLSLWVHWHVCLIFLSSLFCFFFDFVSGDLANVFFLVFVSDYLLNIWLPLFWSTWSQARGQD